MTKTKSGHRTLHFDKVVPLKVDRDRDLAIEKRGTKRDIYSPDHDKVLRSHAQFQFDDDNIDGSFNTARSPPLAYYAELLKLLREHDPEATIYAEYNEPGIGFFGSRENGEGTEYDYADLIRCESLEEYIVHPDMGEIKLDLFSNIYGDGRYYPQDALDDLESYEYNADNKKQLEKDIKMCEDLLNK